MFEFKKAMQDIMQKEDYECECCGSMDANTNWSSGCSSGCGSANNSCCAPVKDSDAQKSGGTSCQSSCAGNDNLNKK